MKSMTRRDFVASTGLALGTIVAPTLAAADKGKAARPSSPVAASLGEVPPVDFRYAPLSYQTAYCFPDDLYKSLVGQMGELRFSRNPQTWPQADYPEQVEFSFLGMEANPVAAQKLEAPGVPIIHTAIQRPAADIKLITFATNRPEEGRVDNVLMEIVSKTGQPIQVVPVMIVRTKRDVKIKNIANNGLIFLDDEAKPLFATVSTTLGHCERTGLASHCALKRGQAKINAPLRVFFRFPQEKQDHEKIKAGLANPHQLLEETRHYWQQWRPFGGKLQWQVPVTQQNFLTASARNILQAREVRDGKLTFQVGPTCYRGLWVVDGNFILEAAKYLGYDAEVQKGLEATWARQGDNGGIFAGGGSEHWKDTGIAMFTLVRLAELSQDWAFFRQMSPQALKAVKFLKNLRDQSKTGNHSCGRYGLLAPGFCDGGIGGLRSEFTNTLWVLAGLRAVVNAADQLGMTEFDDAKVFYQELRSACFNAMRQEMHAHPKGFEYLHMVMKDDPQFNAPDEWDRLRPQGAQWALSHAIFPGLLFDRNDPVVKGHISLMQACTQEDVPIETGWIPHEGLWTYNAPFVSHVYLWAGLSDWARRTFVGFLNHASPLYCWREEQPLRGSLVSTYVGDMPHNWASAMCVIFLRHVLALEDGQVLRLLAGIGDYELKAGEPFLLNESPTRFGRVSLQLEPLKGGRGWTLRFQRGSGPQPAAVQIPMLLGARHRLQEVNGAAFDRRGMVAEVAPQAMAWSARWTK